MSENLHFSADLDISGIVSPLKSLESQLQNTQVIFSNFASSFSEGTQSIEAYEQTLSQLEAAHASAADSTQQLADAGSTLGDSFSTLASSNDSVASSFETIGQATQNASGSFDTLGQAVEGLTSPLESTTGSFETLAGTIDGLGSPFQTLAQTTEEYSGVLTSTGDAVTTFEATSATLTDTLTNEQTILTDTQTSTEDYNGILQELEPSIRQVESGVLDSATALDETNTLTENLSGTTETYTGALANLETELATTTQTQEQNIQTGESMNSNFVSLGASSLSLATNVFGLIRNYDNLQKSELSVERSALAYEKAVTATDKAQVSFTDTLLKSSNTTTEVKSSMDALMTATDAYTALLDEGVTSGAEFESAQENLAFATENMRQAMLNAGFSIEETDIIMAKLTNTIESQYVRAQQLAQRENDLLFNQLNTGFTILGAVASVVSTASDAFTAYGRITQSLIPHINAASVAIGGLSISVRSLLIASGVGIALAALGTIVGAFAQSTSEATATSEQFSNNALPGMGQQSEQAGQSVETLREKFLDLYSTTLPETSDQLNITQESMGKTEEKSSSLQKALGDLGNAFVKGVTDAAAAIDSRLSAAIDEFNNKGVKEGISGLEALQIQIKAAFGQASQEEIDKLNKHMQETQNETGKINSLWDLFVPKKAEAFNPEPVSNYNAILGQSLAIGDDYTKQIVQNSVERLKNNDIIASMTDSEIASVAATEAAANAILEQNKTLLAGRQVTTEALLEWDEYKKSLAETPQTVQQVQAKFDELFPSIDKAKLASEAHLEALIKENEGLAEQAIQAGVSAESVVNFSTHIDENTGKVVENAAAVTEYNTVLRNLIADSIDVTAAFTDVTRNSELMSQGFLSGKQSAQEFADQLVRNSQESQAYLEGLRDIADELGLKLDPRLQETAKNYELLLKTQDGTRESALAYVNAISQQVTPALQKLSQIGETVQQGFEQMAQSFENGKKEVMELVDFLPGKLEKQIKVELEAEVEAQKAEEELKAAISTLVTKTESGKFEMRPDIEISPKTAEKTIDAFRDKVGDLIANRPLEAAKWEPLFNQLESASSLKGQDAVDALEKILTDPKNVNLLSGAGVELGDKTGAGLIEALEKQGVEIPPQIKEAILSSEGDAVAASAQIGEKGGTTIANEASGAIEGNQDFKTALSKAIEDPSAQNLLIAAAAASGDTAADKTGETIEQNATLQGAPGASLENESSLSKTETAGQKHGERFAKGFLIKGKPGESDLLAFGPGADKIDKSGDGGSGQDISKPVKVPAPDVTAYNTALAAMVTRATQTATQITQAFTTGFAGIGTSFTQSSAALQTAMTGLVGRATATATQVVAAFTRGFAGLGTSFTQASATLQTAMTGLVGRATATATQIVAQFQAGFTRIAPTFGTASAALQQQMTALVARARISAVAMVDTYEAEFKLIAPAFGVASAGLQQQMTALVTSSRQRAVQMVDAFEAEFKLITPAFGLVVAGLVQQMTSIVTTATAKSTEMAEKYGEAFKVIIEASGTMTESLLEHLETYGTTTMEALDMIVEGYTKAFQELIMEMMSKVFASLTQMVDPGFVDVNTNALDEIVTYWEDSWQEDILGAVSKAAASINQIIVGIAATVGRETGKMTTEFEDAAEAWVDAVEQAREDMEEEFDKMVEAAEKAAAKIKAAMSSARGGASGKQFGMDEIVEAGENRLLLVGEGNTRERVTISPEGTAGFSGAGDFGGGGTSRGGGASSNVPVNVTINETSHNYMDSEIVSRKVNRRVYKNVSGTLG